MYLNRFAHIMSQYLQSVEGIAAIFNYMNRFYVKPKKNSELKSELLMIFTASIADNERLFGILCEVFILLCLCDLHCHSVGKKELR